MFTFAHITSIGISEKEYNERLVKGEKNLVKGETRFYREVKTNLTIPETVEEVERMMRADEYNRGVEKIKCGGKVLLVPSMLKDLIVGMKLAVNQKVQAAERDGGMVWKDVLMKIVQRDPAKLANQKSTEFRAFMLLNGKAQPAKEFVEKWLAENPEFMGE